MAENFKEKNSKNDGFEEQSDDTSIDSDSLDGGEDEHVPFAELITLAKAVEVETIIWMKSLRTRENQNWQAAAWKRISNSLKKPSECTLCS